MSRAVVGCFWIMLGLFCAGAASAATVYTTDGGGSVTAYFSGNKLLGFHLKDEKCDGRGVVAKITYNNGLYDTERNVTNYQGCGKDLWDDRDLSRVKSMQVCTLVNISGRNYAMYCARVY